MNRAVRASVLASLALACALIFSTPAFSQPAVATGSARILVGPNILVSRDGDIPHVELMLAASPRSSRNLLGGAITFSRPNGGNACRAYASTDGGTTWSMSDFSEQVEFGGGDPQVAYTAQGTALFVGLAFVKDEEGREAAGLSVYRSEDGGKSWGKAIDLGANYDHEQMVVDTTSGRYAGRIYIGVLYGYPIYQVGVLRSDDDGRTWTGPVEAANGGGTLGLNDVTPMVLSDGTLVFPYADFDFLPGKQPTKGRFDAQRYWTVISQDGGVTFSAPRKVGGQQYDLDDHEASLSGFGKFAADSESRRFPDRIYFASEDSRLGPHRILLSYSTDRGKTWSAPKAIDNGVSQTVKQFQPAIAVNVDGVVGVTWFDTRGSASGQEYDEYFAASLDGGVTFLPPVRVSSASSNPKGRGNRLMTPSAGTSRGAFVLALMSAAGWSSGGHYMGLAADKGGDFHPFWVDARTGTSQIYSARVRVELSGKAAASRGTAAAAKSVSAVETLLTDRVELIFDPTTFDAETNEMRVPIRLKNTSAESILPPIRLEYTGIETGTDDTEGIQEFWKDKKVSIQGASNGKEGEGAILDFSAALGSAQELAPGGQTNPVVLRLRLSNPDFAPAMRWKATGQIAKP